MILGNPLEKCQNSPTPTTVAKSVHPSPIKNNDLRSQPASFFCDSPFMDFPLMLFVAHLAFQPSGEFPVTVDQWLFSREMRRLFFCENPAVRFRRDQDG